MFTCSKCGKKFKSMGALGGHCSIAHAKEIPQGSDDPGSVPDQLVEPVEAAPAASTKEDETGIMEDIRRLRDQGYTARQVKEIFGYARSTVDQVYAEVFKPEGRVKGDEGVESGLPVTVKGTESITPEFIINRLSDGSEEWRLRLEGMMLLRAAQRMVMDDVEIMRARAEADARLIEPILKLMREAREEQDAAAQRAKASVTEAAREAAYEAASETAKQVAAYFEQKKPDIASTSKPLEGLFARLLEITLPHLMGQLLPGAGGNVPVGFTVEKGDL